MDFLKKHFYKFYAFLTALYPGRIFMRLNLTNKMLIGYAILIVSSISIFIYAETSFKEFSNLNTSIVNVDITVQKAAREMTDIILDQDNYEKRFLILKSSDMINLFWQRGAAFHQWLDTLWKLRNQKGMSIEEQEELSEVDKIDSLYKEYESLINREVDLVKARRTQKAYFLSNHDVKETLNKIIDSLNRMSASAKNYEDLKMRLISVMGPSIFSRTIILWVVSILLAVSAGLLVTYHIISSIHKLMIVTEHVADGDFDYDPQIKTSDEIGALSQAFMTMGQRLRKLEEMYLDASPLTRIPGGMAIENILQKRIDTGDPLAFCLADLDNFKAFNDQYGYARGNEVIKETARIVEKAVKLKGSKDDFVGHIGGDDFVVITAPAFMHGISKEIINQFDMEIPRFYDARDREKGYILGKNRQGVEIKFPIMTISLAIVTNERRKLTSSMEVSAIAAELKDYAKTFPKSIYVIDKRRTT